MKGLMALLLALAATAALTSCATSIPVNVMKPAEINMSGARTIAVLDFDYPRQYRSARLFDMLGMRIRGYAIEGRDSLEYEVASYATRNLISALLNNEYFTVVDSDYVASKLSLYAGSAELSAVDIGRSTAAQAIIVGEIVEAKRTYRIETVKEQIRDAKTSALIDVHVNYTTATDRVMLQYRVVDALSGVILATRSFEKSESVRIKTEDQHRLPSAENVMKGIIDSWIPRIEQQIAPYRVTEYRSLASDKTKNPDMKAADELAKNGAYDAAYERFLKIYGSTRNPAAGINAAVMLDVLGRIDEALATISRVVSETGDKAAAREQARLRQTKSEQERVAEQLR